MYHMSISVLCRALRGGMMPLVFAVLLMLSTFSYAETSSQASSAPTDSVAADTSAVADSLVEDTASHPVRNFFSWSFNKIIQPALNAIVYPIAQPLHYAFDNGVIETAVDLITFGERRNVLLYPILNLKPGNSTMLGFTYRHRGILLDKDYLVVSPQYYANGDWFFDTRYMKHQLFGTSFFGGLRFRKYMNRDGTFILPGTKESFVQPDSSTVLEVRSGFPLTENGHWNLEFGSGVTFVDYSPPDKSQDSILIDRKFFIEDRGLYQKYRKYPVGVTLLFDNLDFPYAPSRGTRMELSGRYFFVSKYSGISAEDLYGAGVPRRASDFEDNGKTHDYLRTEFMLQHYFYFGKAEQFHLTKKESRQNRRFYTDFNWDAALRLWRPENVRETLFERRVIALQYRLIDVWEYDDGTSDVSSFTWVGSRFPFRGYSDSWVARHVMSLSMEYRWPIDYYVDGVLFNEYMMHAPGFKEWSFDRFYNSWGFGVRVRKPDMYWFRVQLGFHGLHGVNLVLTIAPEYH